MSRPPINVRMTDITAVARPIDPNYPTNRAIALLAMLVMVGAAISRLVSGVALIQGALWGVSGGLAVFLAWALGRELDPDHDLSAFVGTGLMLISLLFFELPNLLVLFWVLVLLRIVNRTVGLPARIVDSLLILGLGGWLTWQRNWMYGLMTAVAFLLDARLSPPHSRHSLFAGVALLVTFSALIFGGSLLGQGELSLPTALALLAASALFVPVIVASRALRTLSDETPKPLNPRRVQAAQVLALLTAIQVAGWDGVPGVASLMPLWATILGVSLYRLFVVVYRILPFANCERR